jgi:hypothetical protein
VVTEPEKYISVALSELDSRLDSARCKSGLVIRSFELLSKLADCGLELHLEWPPETRVVRKSFEGELTKPTKLPEAPGIEIADEDIPSECCGPIKRDRVARSR